MPNQALLEIISILLSVFVVGGSFFYSATSASVLQQYPSVSQPMNQAVEALPSVDSTEETDLGEVNELNEMNELAEADEVIETAELSKLINDSKYILRIIPTDIEKRNEVLTKATLIVVDVYKGEYTGKKFLLDLPSNVEAHQEYLVFLNDYHEVFFPVSNQDHLIKLGTPEFETVLELLAIE